MRTRRRKTDPRLQQRQRTRKDLLAAASRLLHRGIHPDMDAVAREAMVSRATTYRYFPSIEALLIEAPIDGAVPEPADVFSEGAPNDPVARVDAAEAALHEMVYRNEKQLRLMLAASIERKARGDLKPGTPLRQNRRTALIDAALAPHRRALSRSSYEKLTATLALVFGVESMIVCSDVLGLDAKSARRMKSWAIRALVSAARNESHS